MLGNMTKDGGTTKIDFTKSEALTKYLLSLAVKKEFLESYTWFFACLTQSDDVQDSKTHKNSVDPQFLKKIWFATVFNLKLALSNTS